MSTAARHVGHWEAVRPTGRGAPFPTDPHDVRRHARTLDELREGSAFVYHGGAAGFPDRPSTTLDNPASSTAGDFGGCVAAAGRPDGPGWTDGPTCSVSAHAGFFALPDTSG
jgi:hypothetical protein